MVVYVLRVCEVKTCSRLDFVVLVVEVVFRKGRVMCGSDDVARGYIVVDYVFDAKTKSRIASTVLSYILS